MAKNLRRRYVQRGTNLAKDEHPLSLDPDGIDHLIGVIRKCRSIEEEIAQKYRERTHVLKSVRGYGINTSAVKLVLKRMFQTRTAKKMEPTPFEGVNAEDAIAYWSILLTVEEFYEHRAAKDKERDRSGDS